MLFLTENSFKGVLCFMRSTGTKTEISSTVVWELKQALHRSHPCVCEELCQAMALTAGQGNRFVSLVWDQHLNWILDFRFSEDPSVREFNSMLKALHRETLEMWSNEQSMDQMKSSYLLQFIFWTVLIINLILACNLLVWFALDY